MFEVILVFPPTKCPKSGKFVLWIVDCYFFPAVSALVTSFSGSPGVDLYNKIYLKKIGSIFIYEDGDLRAVVGGGSLLCFACQFTLRHSQKL